MSKEDKTWTVVGTSVQRGEKTLRLANGTAADRRKVLEKAGCTEIRLFDLPRPMRREEAEAWLAAQGDAVPQPAPKAPPAKQVRAQPASKPAARDRNGRRAVTEPAQESGPLAFEELGRELYMGPRTMRVLPWDECSIEVRQEFCRNAARAAGHATPRGMFPELERWLESDGIRVLEDGTLVERQAA